MLSRIASCKDDGLERNIVDWWECLCIYKICHHLTKWFTCTFLRFLFTVLESLTYLAQFISYFSLTYFVLLTGTRRHPVRRGDKKERLSQLFNLGRESVKICMYCSGQKRTRDSKLQALWPLKVWVKQVTLWTQKLLVELQELLRKTKHL